MSVLHPGLPNLFSLADTNRPESSLVKARFRDVQIETVNVTFEFASGEDSSYYCQAISAQARMALSKETKERREEWEKKQRRIMELLTALLEWIMNLYVWRLQYPE
jgi:hypothetical protein